MLIDTDILIWYMRGNEKARALIAAQPGFRISVVTYMELVQGMRNKAELRALKKALRAWQAGIIHIDHEISSKAMFYVEQHYLGHVLALADALIAATAVSMGLTLITGNHKHYRIIRDLHISRFEP